MRIGISARGLSAQSGGVRSYIEKLIPWLIREDLANEYVIFHAQADLRGSFGNAEDVLVKAVHPVLWENHALVRALRASSVDLLFGPKNLLPRAQPPGTRTVVTVHDLLYFPLRGVEYREYKWLDIIYMRVILPRVLQRADQIVAVSQNTRRDLLELFSLQSEIVHVVPHGCDEEAVSPEAVKRVRMRHGLRKPYVFYPGSLSPRKNVARAVEAFATIGSDIEHDFVVTAGKSWLDTEVYRTVRRLGLEDRFHVLGHVNDEEVRALYTGADACVYVSLYEGFGFPVLEAMACGCPVLTSNTSSLPEVAGDAALLVDPRDTKAIAAGLKRLLSDPAAADCYRSRGRERAATFTWRRCARETISVFEAAMERERL